MTKTLPPEIVRSVVIHLKNDKKSLHSCILVSRDWCRETVDLLWMQPFHFLYTCNNSTSSQFTTVDNFDNCSCSEERRLYQINNLLITYLSIKYNDELFKGEIIKTKGGNFFNYFEFLNVLDLNELYFTLKEWIRWIGWNMPNKSMNSSLLNFLISKFNLINLETLSCTPLTFNNIFRYFFTSSQNLKLLSCDTEFTLHKFNNNNLCSSLIKENHNHWDNYGILNNLLINESNIPETKQFFANLTELILTAKERKTKLLSCLSQICHNIEKLIVRVKFTIITGGYAFNLMSEVGNALEESKQLASLISSQHNLVYFELFDIHDEGTNEILESLKETQCKSLKTLILNNVFISDNDTVLFHLKYLRNLQELRFNKCIYKKDNHNTNKYDWEDLWLPNLKCLEANFVDKYKEDSEELSSILLRCSPLVDNI